MNAPTFEILELRPGGRPPGQPTLMKNVTLLVIPLALLVSGCRVSAPKLQGDRRIHSPEDIAANPEQLRLRMRSLVQPMCGRITTSADQIIASTTNRQIQRAALVWKIEAVPAL